MKRTGERFYVEAVLHDENKLNVDTDAHVHVYRDGVQIAKYIRSSGQVSYDIVSRRYRCALKFNEPCRITYQFDFPEIEYITELFPETISGPTIVET